MPQSSSPSLAFRGFLAIGLMIGFYIFALGIASGLFFIPYAEWHFGGRLHVKIALACVISGCIILWCVIPRIDRFRLPGPLLKPADNPKLFSMIREIAEATGQEMPSEVYLCHDLNAWVSQRGGIMGIGSRRVMGLGLPLMQVLSVSQLRAVLVHEFGHYHGGDTKLGPWIWKTRGAIIRTVQGLEESLLQLPFIWYAKGFLRITHAISRRQEISADALAAKIAGAQHLADSLKIIHGTGFAFNGYWTNEVVPVLGNGYRPPIASGFIEFTKAPKIAEAVQMHLAEEMDGGKSDPYDTHPCLRDRLAFLEGLPQKGIPSDSSPAMTLLGNLDHVEPLLLTALAGETEVDKLKPVDWGEVGKRVWLPLWEKSLQESIKALDGVTVAGLSALTAEKDALAKRLSPKTLKLYGIKEAVNESTQILGMALAVTLANSGWSINALPGAEIVLELNGSSIEPFTVVRKLVEEEAVAGEWLRPYESTGIASLSLVPPMKK